MSEESDTTREISQRREEIEVLRSELESLDAKLREARNEHNLAQKESSKETSEVFKLLATPCTATAAAISVIAASVLPDAEGVRKLWLSPTVSCSPPWSVLCSCS